jgi:hypothetical protein
MLRQLMLSVSKASRDGDFRQPAINAPTTRSMRKEIAKAAATLHEFVGMPDSAIPARLLEHAKGIAFLTMLKGGFLWAGKMGTGLVVARNAQTGGVGLGLTIARDVVRGHGGDVRIEAGSRCIHVAIHEPLGRRRLPIENLRVGLHPGEQLGAGVPEALRIAGRLVIDPPVVLQRTDPGTGGKLRRGRKHPALLHDAGNTPGGLLCPLMWLGHGMLPLLFGSRCIKRHERGNAEQTMR